MLSSVIAIAIGAAFGALLRWALSMALNPVWPMIPLGTLTANLVGGLLIGVANEVFRHYGGLAPEWRLFVITGFMGGLTTFSTFSMETATLIQSRELATAAFEIGMHVTGSVCLTLLGIVLVRFLARGI